MQQLKTQVSYKPNDCNFLPVLCRSCDSPRAPVSTGTPARDPDKLPGLLPKTYTKFTCQGYSDNHPWKRLRHGRDYHDFLPTAGTSCAVRRPVKGIAICSAPTSGERGRAASGSKQDTTVSFSARK